MRTKGKRPPLFLSGRHLAGRDVRKLVVLYSPGPTPSVRGCFEPRGGTLTLYRAKDDPGRILLMI